MRANEISDKEEEHLTNPVAVGGGGLILMRPLPTLLWDDWEDLKSDLRAVSASEIRMNMLHGR
jgi:hypothetical protein